MSCENGKLPEMFLVSTMTHAISCTAPRFQQSKAKARHDVTYRSPCHSHEPLGDLPATGRNGASQTFLALSYRLVRLRRPSLGVRHSKRHGWRRRPYGRIRHTGLSGVRRPALSRARRRLTHSVRATFGQLSRYRDGPPSAVTSSGLPERGTGQKSAMNTERLPRLRRSHRTG